MTTASPEETEPTMKLASNAESVPVTAKVFSDELERDAQSPGSTPSPIISRLTREAEPYLSPEKKERNRRLEEIAKMRDQQKEGFNR